MNSQNDSYKASDLKGFQSIDPFLRKINLYCHDKRKILSTPTLSISVIILIMFVCKGCCCYCHVSHEIRNISIRQTLLPLPLRKLHLRLQLHHLPDRQHLPSQVPLDQHHLEFIKYFRVYQQNTNLDYDIHFRNATHQDSSFQDLSGRYLQSWNMNFSEYLNVVFVILASTFTITGNWVICL